MAYNPDINGGEGSQPPNSDGQSKIRIASLWLVSVIVAQREKGRRYWKALPSKLILRTFSERLSKETQNNKKTIFLV